MIEDRYNPPPHLKFHPQWAQYFSGELRLDYIMEAWPTEDLLNTAAAKHLDDMMLTYLNL